MQLYLKLNAIFHSRGIILIQYKILLYVVDLVDILWNIFEPSVTFMGFV